MKKTILEDKMDKKIFVVGFAVECDDLRDHTKFTDYTERIAT